MQIEPLCCAPQSTCGTSRRTGRRGAAWPAQEGGYGQLYQRFCHFLDTDAVYLLNDAMQTLPKGARAPPALKPSLKRSNTSCRPAVVRFLCPASLQRRHADALPQGGARRPAPAAVRLSPPDPAHRCRRRPSPTPRTRRELPGHSLIDVLHSGSVALGCATASCLSQQDGAPERLWQPR